MRNMRMRMRIENLIHIIHIWIFAKNGNFLGQKWVSLALFSILSAQNIIIVHTSWFYPSSGMKIKSPKSQNFGQEKMIFFYYWCGLCALMRIWCASMRISKNRRMASPNINAMVRSRGDRFEYCQIGWYGYRGHIEYSRGRGLQWFFLNLIYLL